MGKQLSSGSESEIRGQTYNWKSNGMKLMCAIPSTSVIWRFWENKIKRQLLPTLSSKQLHLAGGFSSFLLHIYSLPRQKLQWQRSSKWNPTISSKSTGSMCMETWSQKACWLAKFCSHRGIFLRPTYEHAVVRSQRGKHAPFPLCATQDQLCCSSGVKEALSYAGQRPCISQWML